MEAFGQSVDQNCKINRRIYTDRLPSDGMAPRLCLLMCFYYMSVLLGLIWVYGNILAGNIEVLAYLRSLNITVTRVRL